MAGPAIIWRNPKSPQVQRIRQWAHVRRDEHRSLYLILETRAKGEPHWEGLPSLEVLQSQPTATKKEKEKESGKWHFLPWSS